MELSGSPAAFDKPRGRAAEEPTLHLYVANCGPAVGLSLPAIEKAFSSFGPVTGIRSAGDSGTRVVVSFQSLDHAVAAKENWSGRPCDLLHGRVMFLQYSVPRPPPWTETQLHSAMISSSEIGIPGLTLYHDFVTVEEEEALLAGVDALPWQTLAKRRVQHYGYEFLYKSRNVDVSQRLGSFPGFLGNLVERMSEMRELTEAEEVSLPLDQLTVNEYPKGVGLSPHIDTHSAFEGSILSLSLAGPCVMEFRRYQSGTDEAGEGSGDNGGSDSSALSVAGKENHGLKKGMEQRALFLPERSLLVLSDEARYAWHHYIPHHKIDQVVDEIIPRSPRRVSFTFRKVRSGACNCNFAKHCDSQASDPSGHHLNTENTKSVDLENLVEGRCEGSAEAESTSFTGEVSQKKELLNYRAEVDNLDQMAPSTSLSSSSKTSQIPISDEDVCLAENEVNDNFLKAVSLITPEIEKLYVHKVYDAIAPHFSATRFAKWPKVASFLEALAPGSLVADSGCGNGKYLGYNPKCFFIGCDISPPLVAICAQRGHEALVADSLHLPHRTGFYDAAISIAVLHHLSNENRRRRAIEELVRVVCSGGKVLITVWAREQEDQALVNKWTPLSHKYLEEWVGDQESQRGLMLDGHSPSLGKIQEGDVSEDFSFSKEQTKQEAGQNDVDSAGIASEHQQEYFVPWHLPYHRADINGASAEAVASGFARKDEKKGAVVYDRYYHVFAEGELERLATGIEGARIIDRFYDKSNWCIVLQKS